MSFAIPEFDNVASDGGNVAEEGWHDVTLQSFSPKESKSGRDMMVIDMIIDNGPSSGHTLTEYIVFGLKGMMGEAKLKGILESASSRWRPEPTLQKFCEQFPWDKLRVAVLVKHEYSIDRDGEWQNVPHDVWEHHDGKKNRRAVPDDYRAVSAPKKLVPAGDGASAEVEDDLPF